MLVSSPRNPLATCTYIESGCELVHIAYQYATTAFQNNDMSFVRPIISLIGCEQAHAQRRRLRSRVVCISCVNELLV